MAGLDGVHTGPPLRAVKDEAAWAEQGGARPVGRCELTEPGCLPGLHVHAKHPDPATGEYHAFPITSSGQLAGRPDAPRRPVSRTELRRDHAARVAAGRPDRTAVRSWAMGEGLPVSPRGALPRDVVEAWNRAHPGRPYVDGATDPARYR